MVDERLETTRVTEFSPAIAREPKPRSAEESLFRSTMPLDVEASRPNRSPSDRTKDKLLGTKIDTYWIRAVLGQGGMGRVYLAWHERLERLSAVKVVLPEFLDNDPRRLEMFFVEARSAAKLHHPHVVSIHSLGNEGDHHFIEMEYVDGASLRDLLRQSGTLGPAQATRLISQIASALAAAHRQGIIHCDVKPDNVMVTRRGQAKLADFGLARAFSAPRTKSRGIVGTPPYIAPEIYLGEPACAASDIYALGITYYMLLTGVPPFTGDTLQQICEHHLHTPPPRLTEVRPDLPIEIADLVESMLSKSQNLRPECGNAFVERLEGIANSLVPLQHLVAEAMVGLDVEWSGEEETFTFNVSLAGGRKQIVQAEILDNGEDDDRLLSFWTPCAPAQTKHFEYVLKLNGRLPFGAISIRNYKDRPYFIMVDNHARKSVSPWEIRTAVIHLSVWADMLEHHLTGQDVH